MFADKQAALDAVTRRDAGHLADDAEYQAAAKTLPRGDAIARFYASSAGLQTALGAAKSEPRVVRGSLGSITARSGSPVR